MSCTIFYKGTLKDNYNTSDVLVIVTQHILNMNAEMVQANDPIIVRFLQGESEPLVFDFTNKRMDSSCKWNGDNPEEFYRIFDMFLELKPLFKSLRIDDDDGLWLDYVAQKNPCKIKLRPLHTNEMKFLDLIKANENTPLNEIEKIIMAEIRLTPFYNALLRAIVQDFVKIMNIYNVEDFKPQAIIDLADELNFMGECFYKSSVAGFNYHFSSMLLQVWLVHTFEYKKMGLIKELPNDIRGLNTSKIAAFYGIRSIFLNCHVGVNNAKEAEMHKLAKKYYKTGALGEVMVIDKPEKELEFLFSMMDYLGFNYVGVDYRSVDK